MAEKTDVKTTLCFPKDVWESVNKYMEENKLVYFKDAVVCSLRNYYNGKPFGVQAIPESCKKCSCHYAEIINGKVLCITKKENQPTRFKYLTFGEALACSKTPTIPTKSKEELTADIKYLNEQLDYFEPFESRYKKQQKELFTVQGLLYKAQQELLDVDKSKKVIEERDQLLSENGHLKGVISEKNTLLATLEMDNMQLKEECSHDPLFEQNQLFREQLTEKDYLISKHEKEILKAEAYSEILQERLNDVANTARKLVQDIKIQMTASNINDVSKRLSDFEGYLNTLLKQKSALK